MVNAQGASPKGSHLSIRKWAFLGIATLAVAAFFAINMLRAATGMTIANTLTVDQSVMGHQYVSLFAINVGTPSGGETLNAINVKINLQSPGGATLDPNAITSSVLEDLIASGGGLSVWKASNPAAVSFDQFNDLQLLISPTNYANDGAVTVNLNPTPTLSTGDKYYLVARVDDMGLSNGQAVTFTLPANAVTTSVGAQTSNAITTAKLQVAAQNPKIVSMEYLNTGAPLAQGSQIRVKFNQSMSNISWAPSNLQSNFYCYNPANYISGVWGGNPAVNWSKTQSLNDTATITFGTNPTIANGMKCTPYATSQLGVSLNDPFFIDTNKPFIKSATVIKSQTGHFRSKGDKMVLMFGGAGIDETTLNSSNANVRLLLSGGQSWAVNPRLTWITSNMVVVTLAQNQPSDLDGVITIDADVNVKSQTGFGDNTVAPPTIMLQSPNKPMLTTLIAADNDNSVSPGIDKNDLTVTHQMGTTTDSITHYVHFFVLPLDGKTTFDPTVDYRFNSTAVVTNATSPQIYNANSSTYSIFADSRCNYAVNNSGDCNNFIAGVPYVVFGATSTVQNPVNVNDYGVFSVSSPFYFTSENALDYTRPEITAVSPGNGATNVGTNLQSWTVQFSKSMDVTKFNNSNVTLAYDNDGNGSYETSVSILKMVYMGDSNLEVIQPNGALVANKKYQLTLSTAITDTSGNALMSNYNTVLTTGSSSVTTAPKVTSSTVGNNATNVSPTMSDIRFAFDQPMDWTRVNIAGLAFNPLVTGKLTADINSNTLVYTFSQALNGNSPYTINIMPNGAQYLSAYNVQLDGDGNNTAGGNYALSFQTGNLDTVAPSITSADGTDSKIEVVFDKDMSLNDVTGKNNWTVTCNNQNATVVNYGSTYGYTGGGTSNYVVDTTSSASAVSLSSATFTYSAKKLTISGLFLMKDASCTITASNTIRSSAGTGISNSGKSRTFSVHSDYSSSYTAAYSNPNASTYNAYTATFSQPSVWVTNQQTGATTNYGMYVPMNGVSFNGKLQITFPSGFTVTNAAMDPASTDLNGSGSGTVTGTVSADNVTKVVTITLSGPVSSTDSLSFILDNIVNGPAAEIDYTTYNSTTKTYNGGYQLSIAALNTDGTTVFSGVKTYQFGISGTPTGSFSGTVRDSNGAGVNGATVKAWGSGGGEVSTTTAANGTYTLAVNNGTYYPFVSYQGSYVYGTSGVTVSGTAQVVTGIDFTITSKSDTINVTVTHSAGLAGKQASIYCWDQKTYENVSKTITLASSTSTMASLSVTAGTKTCSLYEAFNFGSTTGTAGGYTQVSSFTAPASQNVTVSGSANVTFALSTADKVISGFVYDQTGAGLANVSISIFTHNDSNYSGETTTMMGGSTWTSTKSDGSFSANVSAAATYIVAASQAGIGNLEQQVVMNANGTTSPSSVVFRMTKTNSTITGTVLDNNNNPLQYVSILAKGATTGQTQYSSTDSTGKYTLFVGADTWTINANAYNSFPTCTLGNNTSCSVTVAANATGNANFKADPSKSKTISGTVTVDGVAVQYANVSAQLLDATGKQVGFTPAWSSTDADGKFSLTVTPNSNTQHYRIQASTFNNGKVGSQDNIDVSTNNATGITLTSNATTVTMSITNAPSGVNSVSLNAKNSTDTTDVGKWNSISFTSGSGSASFNLAKNTTQKIRLNIPGYPDQTPTSVTSGGTLNVDGTVTLTGSTAAITFNLNSLKTATITVTGTVTTGGSTPVANASVTLSDGTAGTYVQTLTGSNGTYTLTAQSGGTYKLFVKATGYIGTETKVTASGTKNLSLSPANSTISGVLQQNGVTTDGTVWAQSSDGAWTQTVAQSDATWSLAVPTGKTWTVTALTKSGYTVSSTNVASGTSNVTLNATTVAVSSFADPASTQATPGSGAILDDRTSTGTGMFVSIAPGSYTNSNASDATGASTLTAKEKVIAEVADNAGGLDAVGLTATEVTQSDSSGLPITSFTTPVTLTLMKDKARITGAIETGDMTKDQIDSLQMGYWDEASQSWIALATTETCEVKTTVNSVFAAKSCTELEDDIKTGAVTYYDYHMILAASTTHFTVFGAVVPADATAPSAPTGLAATAASSTSVSLSWTANTETDLLEYEIYRSTTSGFTPSSTTQINTSSVTANSYTDSGLTAGTTYYYKITAADTSGNESSASSEASVTPTAEEDSTPPDDSTPGSSVTITSGGGSANNTGTDSADSTGTEVATGEESTQTTEVVPESGLDYTDHWAESYIQILVDRGVVSGYADAPEGYTMYFAPDNSLTRAELAKIVINLFQYVAVTVDVMPFTDVDTAQWYAPFIEKLKELGVVSGYADGTYKPDQAITRAEALKILLGTAGKDVENYVWESNPFRDVSTDEWYAPYVLYAYDHGYVGGYKDADGNLTGEFGPADEITRGEMAKMATEVAGLAN